MKLSRFLRPALPLLAVCLAFPASRLSAADEKKEEKKEEAAASGATLSQFKLGEAIANGPVSDETTKGKVVVLEFWGIH